MSGYGPINHAPEIAAILADLLDHESRVSTLESGGSGPGYEAHIDALLASADAQTAREAIGIYLEQLATAAGLSALQDQVNNLPSVSGAIAGMSAGGVGTYALMHFTGSAEYTAGAIVAGSSLRYSAASYGFAVVPSGSWRLMGYIRTVDAATVSLWLRVS